MVDVTGKVTSRTLKPGTITISIDPGVTRSTDVDVDSGTRNVTTERFDDKPRPVTTSASPSSLEVMRPVFKLAVNDVRAVHVGATGPACQ